jgi:hypothetical protein
MKKFKELFEAQKGKLGEAVEIYDMIINLPWVSINQSRIYPDFASVQPNFAYNNGKSFDKIVKSAIKAISDSTFDKPVKERDIKDPDGSRTITYKIKEYNARITFDYIAEDDEVNIYITNLKNQKSLGSVAESKGKCTKKAKDFLNKLSSMERQVLEMKLLDRARTNYDTNWQKEYFYGKMKSKSEQDIKYINDLFVTYGANGVKEEDLVACIVGDPEKYFRDMKF